MEEMVGGWPGCIKVPTQRECLVVGRERYTGASQGAQKMSVWGVESDGTGWRTTQGR